MSEQAPRRPAPFRRQPESRLLAIFIATLAGTALLLAFVLAEVYQQAGQRAETDAGNIVSVVEARLSTTLRRLQADLEHLAVTVPVEALAPDAGERYRDSLERQLSLYAARFPEIIGYRVIDAAGQLRYYSQTGRPPINASDRDYFVALRDDPSLPLVFSRVLTGRVNGRPMLIVAAPVRDPAGVFRGVVMAPLDLGYLQQMFDGVDLGPHGVVALRRSDNGRLVLRRPLLPQAVNQVLSDSPLHRSIEAGEEAGSLRFQTVLDGVERQYAFRRLGGHPFYVAVGIAADDYLAHWRTLAAVVGLAALGLILTLSLVLVRLLRAEREEAAISARLGESEARYRLLADSSHDVIWTLDIAARRLTYVSPSVAELCGHAPHELVGQPPEHWLTADSAARLAAEIALCLKRIAAGDRSAQVVTCELEQLCRDGGSVSTEVVCNCLFDAEGVPRMMLGITRNVSERKAAEQALRESNRQLQLQLDEIGRLQAALQEQAVRDGLTGLFNRRYLDEMLEREVSRARREGIPLALVMLDIDHFKQVNDTYGHQAGDEVLRTLAATLRADIRTEDMACRYGGEEFLIVLPGMPLAAAIERAEGWRQAVEARLVGEGGFSIGFTISLGVAAYPEHGKTPDDLTRCADQALYRAKAAGRNRVLAHAA
ncbi:MAG TPA: diguanylate cyclase [Azonexus sp.]